MNSQETEIEKEKELEQKVQEYWTCRAHDFSTVRKNELKDNEISGRWLAEISQNLPVSSGLDILDVGTGTGYFAILLALHGHRTTGIDFTRAMLQEAEETADSYAANASFLYMDAQALDFPDNSFDAIVTRNLTWTIPEPEKAYQEWHRVLRPGGILLNFDASYADNVRNHNQKESYVSSKDVYGHCGITPELEKKNAEITLSMPGSCKSRPRWDIELLSKIGFSNVSVDKTAGQRILREKDLPDAPLFLIYAKK